MSSEALYVIHAHKFNEQKLSGIFLNQNFKSFACVGYAYSFTCNFAVVYCCYNLGTVRTNLNKLGIVRMKRQCINTVKLILDGTVLSFFLD